MSISWIAPSAQGSSDVVLKLYTGDNSATFDGLVENGKRCSHGIFPLSI